MSVHHFVIKFDTEKKMWEWDTDTESIRFQGCIYLSELDKWVNSAYSEEVYDSDNAISEELGRAIFYLNKLERVG